MTEGEGYCRRRQRIKAEKRLKEDIKNPDKIVVFENKRKEYHEKE